MIPSLALWLARKNWIKLKAVESSYCPVCLETLINCTEELESFCPNCKVAVKLQSDD